MTNEIALGLMSSGTKRHWGWPNAYSILKSETGGKDVAEAWSVKRLPFEPRGWLKQLRADLREALMAFACTPDEVLHATYVSSDKELCDTENVLFYNVGSGSFSKAALNGLRFERVFADPPPPPVPFGDRPAHYQRYSLENTQAGFAHWDQQGTLAQWEAVKCQPLTSTTKPAAVWYEMKCGSTEIANIPTEPVRRFGLSLTVGFPPKLQGGTLNAAGLIKPAFDGIVSSFHSHDGADLEEVGKRIARQLGVDSREVTDHLMAREAAILSRRQLVHLRGEGIQWNPADDLCVAGELLLQPNEPGSNDWDFRGSLFEVTEKISEDGAV